MDNVKTFESQEKIALENKFYKVVIDQIQLQLDGGFLNFYGTVLDKEQDKTFEFDGYTDLSDFCVEDEEMDDGTDDINYDEEVKNES